MKFCDWHTERLLGIGFIQKMHVRHLGQNSSERPPITSTETMTTTTVPQFNSVRNNQSGKNRVNWVEYFLTICGATALEGGPLLWVAIHRKHHQFADKEGDPHSPRDGIWWAHAGWVLMGNALRQDVATLKRYVPDLAEDDFHVWLTKYHLAP